MSRFAKVMIALLAVAVFATPALADYKFSVYGSARVATFYSDWDGEESFDIANQGNSRFGLRGSNGDVSGQYEVASTGALRLMFGTYKFNGGHLMFGQNYGAFGLSFMSSQAYNGDNGFIGYGSLYEGRKPFVKVGLDNGFALWLSQNAQQAQGGPNDGADLPKLAVSYAGKVEGFSYNAAIGYQSNELVDDSVVVGFNGTVDLNPASITFGLGYAVNASTYGIAGQAVAPTPAEETTAIFAMLQAAFKLNASNTLVAGVGYTEEDRSDLNTEKRISAFIQNQIAIAPGFTIVPEFSYFETLDGATVATPETSTYHVGAKWQINF